jgi:hypothetical protein
MDKFPIEGFFAKPGQEVKITDLHGQTLFPSRRADELVVFIEFNGYRRAVFFPRQPAEVQTK